MFFFFSSYFILFLLQDRTYTENCRPQTPTEMDILESIACDQADIIGSDLMDSSTSTEDESFVCEMVSRYLNA